jgi:branched-chain amino acid transport system ATP-binding protein
MIFPEMTVEENLRIGAFPPRSRKATPETLDEVYELFPRLAERRRRAGYVIENGRIAMTGTGAELLDDPQIKVAYLGL